MKPSPQKPPKTIFRFEFEPEGRLGRGKIELLKRIGETGSISAGGRAMDMSYRRAWLLVDEMNRMFHRPVVESQRGGTRGGGAVVTEFGVELVARFEAMQEKIETALAEDLTWLASNHAAPPET